MSHHPVGTLVSFWLPRPVASVKNRRRVFTRGKRVVSLPSEQAVADASMIRTACADAAGGVRFDDDDCLMIEYRHYIATDAVEVRVKKVGVMPAKGKRGTKRDVHGMLETLADAMQGVLYDDDRNVDLCLVARIRG